MKTFHYAHNPDESFKVTGITPTRIYFQSLLTGIEEDMTKEKFDRLRSTEQICT